MHSRMSKGGVFWWFSGKEERETVRERFVGQQPQCPPDPLRTFRAGATMPLDAHRSHNRRAHAALCLARSGAPAFPWRSSPKAKAHASCRRGARAGRLLCLERSHCRVAVPRRRNGSSDSCLATGLPGWRTERSYPHRSAALTFARLDFPVCSHEIAAHPLHAPVVDAVRARNMGGVRACHGSYPWGGGACAFGLHGGKNISRLSPGTLHRSARPEIR